jgi:hypothetical protein
MSAVLAEAVEKLNLKPGQTVREVVNGFTAELRLLDDQPAPETMIRLAPDEQLAFWNALNEPVRPTEPAAPLGPARAGYSMTLAGFPEGFRL